jgi:hypothetical protein
MSVNKVIIVGNLGRDPEIRYMPHRDALSSIYSNYSVSRVLARNEQKKPAYAGLSAKKKAKGSAATCVGEGTVAPGADASGGSDGDGDGDGGDGDDGDGDGDGPRRSPRPIHTDSPVPSFLAPPSRNLSRAARRKPKPKLDPAVVMHAHGLLALVLILILTLAAAFGFVLLERDGLAYVSLGLSAGEGWALARCLVKPK